MCWAAHLGIHGHTLQDVLCSGGSKEHQEGQRCEKNTVKKHIHHKQFKQAIFAKKSSITVWACSMWWHIWTRWRYLLSTASVGLRKIGWTPCLWLQGRSSPGLAGMDAFIDLIYGEWESHPAATEYLESPRGAHPDKATAWPIMIVPL